MTAPDLSGRSDLTVLIADLARVEAALAEAVELVRRELADGKVPDEPHALAFVAITVAQHYNAFEDALQRIARCFEGHLPDGGAWHAELLRRASLELPGLRPAVLDAATFEDAGDLMRFRHFLRHAYGVRLAATKLQLPVDALLRADLPLRAGLARMRQFITALRDSLA